MVKLPGDCLSEIFSYLKDDMHTLYNGVLVDRLWCKNAIRYLWQQPLNLAIKSIGISKYSLRHCTYDRRIFVKLMDTILKTIVFNQNKNQRHLLPLTQSSSIGLDSVVAKAPLFNYISYIRRFDLQELQVIITEWLKYIDSNPQHEIDYVLIAALFKKKFTRSTTKVSFFDNNEFIFNKLVDIISLDKLLEFEWMNGAHGDEFLIEIDTRAKNLQRLKLSWHWKGKDIPDFCDDLIFNIIKSQTGLNEINLFYNYGVRHAKLMNTLQSQLNTLSIIHLRNLNIYCQDFISSMLYLKNLKELTINNCYLSSGITYWPLELSAFNLSKFSFVDSFPSTFFHTSSSQGKIPVAEEFNKTTFESLKTFVYKGHNSLVDFTSISKFISVHCCNNLIHFELDFHINLASLTQILLTCLNLEVVILKDRHWISYYWHNSVAQNIDELLSEVELTKLKFLKLEGLFTYSSESLDNFLRNSNPPLNTLIINGSNCFGNDHMDVILNNNNLMMLNGGILKTLEVSSTIYPRKSVKSRANLLIRNFKYIYTKPKKSFFQLRVSHIQQYPNTRSKTNSNQSRVPLTKFSKSIGC
ncbi:10398_t:CDS:2 [Entrophospora sp. SA101]|nr:10398_t:CDS:2 [Entrophospora sp. SA101]